LETTAPAVSFTKPNSEPCVACARIWGLVKISIKANPTLWNTHRETRDQRAWECRFIDLMDHLPPEHLHESQQCLPGKNGPHCLFHFRFAVTPNQSGLPRRLLAMLAFIEHKMQVLNC
jgi:hypothetical protein